MTEYHLARRVHNDTQCGLIYNTAPKQKQNASVGFGKKPAGHYPCLLAIMVTLCCIILAACVLLGIIYDQDSNENDNAELHRLTSEYQYEQSEVNTQMKKENMHLFNIIAQLERQNNNLTEANTLLHMQKMDLLEGNTLLRTKLERVIKDNGQLMVRNQEHIVQRVWFQEKSQNLTEKNTWLEMKNQNLLNASRFLNAQHKIQIENNTQLQGENLNLTTENDKLRAEKQNLTIQNQVLTQERNQLEQYCPVTDAETLERNCRCQDSWMFFHFKCYFFSSEKMTWQSSRVQCQSNKSDLVIIRSAEEQKFLTTRIRSYDKTRENWWIGLSDLEEEGTWQWLDGNVTTNGLQYWVQRTNVPSEPDNWKGKSKLGEDCGHMSNTEEDQNWFDAPCEETYNWICERGL